MTTKKTDLSALSDEELMIELAKRRTSRLRDVDLTSAALATEISKSDEGARVLAVVIAGRCDAEDAMPRMERLADVPSAVGGPGWKQRSNRGPCGRCRATACRRTYTYKRNDFRCSGRRHDFAPVDDELGVPSNGHVSLEVEKHIADFGVNDVFEEAAVQFTMHYGWSISENLVRRVIDRTADAQESIPEPVHQNALLSQSSTSAKLLPLSLDDSILSRYSLDTLSILSTQKWWQEYKVGVVARAEHLAECRKALLSEHPDLLNIWMNTTKMLIWNGRAEKVVEKVVEELSELLPMLDVDNMPVIQLIRYLTSNIDRTDYPDYRAERFPVCSSVVEKRTAPRAASGDEKSRSALGSQARWQDGET